MKKKIKELKKNMNGVTMIALVVTIIIMLILAGIVINLTLGDKGIITRAKNATEKYKIAEINEQTQLNNLYKQLEFTSDTDSTTNVGEISTLIKEILKEEKLKEYPIGSIYISEKETNPEEFIGGKWERVKDTFLLSAGDIYEAGSSGGEAEHILTIAEMPRHNHSITGTTFTPNSWATGGEALGGTRNVATTNFSGESKAHNNMPPYLTVYMFKRVE